MPDKRKKIITRSIFTVRNVLLIGLGIMFAILVIVRTLYGTELDNTAFMKAVGITIVCFLALLFAVVFICPKYLSWADGIEKELDRESFTRVDPKVNRDHSFISALIVAALVLLVGLHIKDRGVICWSPIMFFVVKNLMKDTDQLKKELMDALTRLGFEVYVCRAMRTTSVEMYAKGIYGRRGAATSLNKERKTRVMYCGQKTIIQMECGNEDMAFIAESTLDDEPTEPGQPTPEFHKIKYRIRRSAGETIGDSSDAISRNATLLRRISRCCDVLALNMYPEELPQGWAGDYFKEPGGMCAVFSSNFPDVLPVEAVDPQYNASTIPSTQVVPDKSTIHRTKGRSDKHSPKTLDHLIVVLDHLAEFCQDLEKEPEEGIRPHHLHKYQEGQ